MESRLDLSHISTRDLCAELEKRDGVGVIEIEPFAPYKVSTESETKEDTGPASIFIVWD